MLEGSMRKRTAVCVAVLVALAPLPLAWGAGPASDMGKGGGAERVAAGSSGPAAVLNGPLRSSRVDFSESRLAGPLAGVCGLGAAAGTVANPVAASGAGARSSGRRGATLVALHCLLTV